ncbi:MAG TPA: HAMP domain-containing sensor histidine kinase [Polyangiaceae bacterium]|nr:HAMP domain-containing sensor histidine kinase [Polyangiaceae bacterium]
MNLSRERLETLDRVRRADRLSTLEHVAAHVAHQLGTPLNVLEGRASLLATTGASTEEIQRNARIIAEQSARMVTILRDLVAFCRRGPNRLGLVDLVDLARASMEVVEPVAAGRPVSIVLDAPEAGLHARGNPDALLVALTHLLENAVRFASRGGTVTVRVARDDDGETGRFAVIDIEDDGPGIDTTVLPRLFQPFTTVHGQKDAGGVGLFVAQSIARAHGGSVQGENRSAQGARFSLRLPEERHDAE